MHLILKRANVRVAESIRFNPISHCRQLLIATITLWKAPFQLSGWLILITHGRVKEPVCYFSFFSFLVTVGGMYWKDGEGTRVRVWGWGWLGAFETLSILNFRIPLRRNFLSYDQINCIRNDLFDSILERWKQRITKPLYVTVCVRHDVFSFTDSVQINITRWSWLVMPRKKALDFYTNNQSIIKIVTIIRKSV